MLDQTRVDNEWLSKRLKIPKDNLPLICNVLTSHNRTAQSFGLVQFVTQVQIFFFLGTSIPRNEYDIRAQLTLTPTTVAEYMTLCFIEKHVNQW